MSGINSFRDKLKSLEAEERIIAALRISLQKEGYQNYGLIKATVNYFTISESTQKNLDVFFEMPKEFINGLAFVEAYSMKGFKHLIVVHQKEDMSIEVANQIVHSNLLDEPFIHIYRFINANEVVVHEYYKDKFLRDPNHYYVLKLDSTRKDFVKKSAISLQEYINLYDNGYETLEELDQALKRVL